MVERIHLHNIYRRLIQYLNRRFITLFFCRNLPYCLIFLINLLVLRSRAFCSLYPIWLTFGEGFDFLFCIYMFVKSFETCLAGVVSHFWINWTPDVFIGINESSMFGYGPCICRTILNFNHLFDVCKSSRHKIRWLRTYFD